jgi:hypothetical protein
MNRSERRRSEKSKKETTYILTESQMEKLKEDAVKDATEKVFIMMLSIPVSVLHDNYWPKTAEKKIPIFIDQCLELYEKYSNNLISIDDLTKHLSDHGGIEIIKEN